MEADIPVFKKCLFYIPLKCGIIAWGCVNLLMAVLFIGLSTNEIFFQLYWRYRASFYFTYIITTIIMIVHFVHSGVLLTAVLKDNCTLLKYYYKYSIIRIYFWTGAIITLNILNLTGLVCAYSLRFTSIWGGMLVGHAALGVIDILIQGYFILVIRSYFIHKGGDFKKIIYADQDKSTVALVAVSVKEIEKEDIAEEQKKIDLKDVKVHRSTSRQLLME